MRKKTYKFGTPLEVDWVDISTSHGWRKPTDKIVPFKVTTIGYFIGYKRGGLTLSPSIAVEEKVIGDIWHIPVGCITRMRRVK